MINFEIERIFLKRVRDLQEDFDNRILELKKEFYANAYKEEVPKSVSEINSNEKNSNKKKVKIETLKKHKKSNDDISFEIIDENLYKNMKLEFNKDEDFMSYNHIIGYYSIEVQHRDYWFKKVIFDHFNRLIEFFNNSDLSFLDYQSIFNSVGIKIIKEKSQKNERVYRPMSFEELENKLKYYYDTNNKKWFKRCWNKIIEDNPDKEKMLKVKYTPILTLFNIL